MNIDDFEHCGRFDGRGVAVTNDRTGPDEVIWLATDHLRLGIVPALGGRLLSLQANGRELIYRNAALLDDRLHRLPQDHLPSQDNTMATWRNYGGDKTWPAPQGWHGPDQWAGPPDPVLDSGPYLPELIPTDDGVVLRLISQADPRTGLAISRIFAVRPGTTSFRLTHRMTNVSDRTVRWAMWNVLQTAGSAPADAAEGDGWYAAVADSDDSVIDLLAGTGVPRYHRDGCVVTVPAQDVVGKLGLPGATGWLATVHDGLSLCQSFTVDAIATYPDRGSVAEIWMEMPLPEPLDHLDGLQPRAYIIESEVLGPLTTLHPGEHAELQVDVATAHAAGAVTAVSRGGLARSRLRVIDGHGEHARQLRVEGSYGVFHDGAVSVILADDTDTTLDQVEVSSAQAGAHVSVETILRAHERASYVQLRSTSTAGVAIEIDRVRL